MTKAKNKSKNLRHTFYKTKKRRKRNYKLEYARRLQRGLAAGKSPSLARGHRTAAEAAFEPNKIKLIKDSDFNKAFKEYEKTKSFRKAAKKIGVSPERFRNQAFAKKLIRHDGKHWIIFSDYPKLIAIFSERKEIVINVPYFETASIIGKYKNAVKKFLHTNVIEHLDDFIGQIVKDTKGKIYVLETDGNNLYRLLRRGTEHPDFYLR